MKSRSRDLATAAAWRAKVHLIGSLASGVICLACGLIIKDVVAVPFIPAVAVSVVAAVSFLVLVTWGMVLVGCIAGHFQSVVDELRDGLIE